MDSFIEYELLFETSTQKSKEHISTTVFMCAECQREYQTDDYCTDVEIFDMLLNERCPVCSGQLIFTQINQ